MANNIEVEARALISKTQFDRLKKFFNKNAKFLDRHKDETLYFDEDGKIRLRKEEKRAYFVHKGGKIHDKYRTELELGIKRQDFNVARNFMESMGKPVVVKWQRERFVWLFRGMKIYLDNTRGYGMIFELESIVVPKDKDMAYQNMLGIFKNLKVKPTPKEKIQKHYQYYLKNWRKLI